MVPDILRGVILPQWGFEEEHVEGYREFTCNNLLPVLATRSKTFLGSIKHTPQMKKADRNIAP